MLVFSKMFFLKRNKIATGDVNIFNHLTYFSKFDIFAILNNQNLTNQRNMGRLVISESIQIEIDTLLSNFHLATVFFFLSKKQSAILLEVTDRFRW